MPHKGVYGHSMGKGKIKSTRQYQPVKFGERFNHASVDSHRLAVKRARQALDCGPSVRCFSQRIHTATNGSIAHGIKGRTDQLLALATRRGRPSPKTSARRG